MIYYYEYYHNVYALHVPKDSVNCNLKNPITLAKLFLVSPDWLVVLEALISTIESIRQLLFDNNISSKEVYVSCNCITSLCRFHNLDIK